MGIATTPDRSVDHDAGVDFGSGAFGLLLKRMEVLQLQLKPDELRRMGSRVFGDRAKSCATCESKNRCESDLAHESAGTITHDWENYCPNATALNAMRALPGIGHRARGLQSEPCRVEPASPRAQAHGLRPTVAALMKRAASIIRNSLHRSPYARELGAEPFGVPDDGVRMVMSDFGMAAYDIWRTGADQRAIDRSRR